MFDIDKLYLSTINYEYDKDSKKITKEFDKDSKKGIQNKMMEYYFTLLCDAGKQVTEGKIEMSRYMHMLHRSIDNDTSLVTNVLKKIEKDDIKNPYEPYQYASLSRQVDIKNAFLTGKLGIGPFALNNNNHIFTMLYDVKFAKSEHGILDVINARSLGNSHDRDGNSILSWISAMINSHVDAAKDPYILRLNVCKYTYNLTNLLLRIGMGQDTLYFMAQPMMKGLADIYERTSGSVSNDPGLTQQQLYKQNEAAFVTSLFTDSLIRDIVMSHAAGGLQNLHYDKREEYKQKAKDYDVEFENVMKALFSIDENGEYKRGFNSTNGWVDGVSILEDLLTNKDVRVNPNEPVSMDNLSTEARYVVGNLQISPKDMQAFIYVAKLQLDEYAEAMSNLVTYTKIDTKKQGINFQEQKNYRENYGKIHDAFEIARATDTVPESMFEPSLERMLDDSFIDKKTQYGTTYIEKILGKHLIYMSDNFQHIVDEICGKVGKRNGKLKQLILKQLLSYVKQKCVNQCMKDHNIDFKPMIEGPNTLAKRINALKRKMLTDTTGKYADYVTNGVLTNRLLSNIHQVPYIPPFGQHRYDILTLDNVESDDTMIQNDYIDSWNKMLESEDEEIRNIANDLAYYAFITSGDNSGFTKFFRYVPVSWRKSSGYADYLRLMNRHFQNGDVTVDGIDSSFFNINTDEFIRNNWTNSDLVPVMNSVIKVNKTRAELEETGSKIHYYYIRNYTGHAFRYKDLDPLGQEVDKNADQVIAGIIKINGRLKTTISKRYGNYPPFIKTKRRYASRRHADQYMLYKLIDVTSRVDDKGKIIEYPIYSLTYPGGLSVKAVGNRYDFYEYERNDGYSHIFSQEAMQGDEYSNHISNICDMLDAYILLFGSLPESLTQVLNDEELIEVDDQGNNFYNLAWDGVIRDMVLNGRKQPDWDASQYIPAASVEDELPFLHETTQLEKEEQEVGKENVSGTILSMESNDNPEFTEADNNIKKIIGNNPLKVVMATEHTDPVPNSQKVCKIINEDRKLPKGQRKYHMLQIMTKHDGLPLLNMLELDIPKTVHFSITGLGGTKWEPGVMKPDDLLDRIEDFIKQGKLNPSLVTVRIDPIIPGVTTPNMIKHIVERASLMGIKLFKISIMDSYSYNDTEKWRRGVYKKMTDLGYDFSKYYIQYSNGNFSLDVKPELIKSIYEKVDEIAQEYGVRMSTCGEKPANVDVKNISFALGCLNAHTVASVLGTTEQEVNNVSEESKQRPGKCHCLNNKIDILSFDDTCFSSCAYCYARHGSDSAYNYYNEDGTLKNNGLTMTRHLKDNNFDYENADLGQEVKINIYAGTGENADLSNFAKRPVSIESPFNFGWVTYKNVEAAFQASKLRFADIDDDTRIDFEERLSKADGPTARKIGKTIPGLDREKWDANSSSIMKTILKLSFVANPEALQKLLATGNATLTHTQDKGKWGTEFPRLLMEVRLELKDRVKEEKKSTTAQYGVVLTNGSKELKETYQKWQEEHPEGIVAYRINFNSYNTPEEVQKGHIGNPFSENSRGEETVKRFYTWIIKGTNFGNPKATEEFRLAIIRKLLETPDGSPVLYYTELGRPSHATVIGYLINHKELLKPVDTQSEEFYTKSNADLYVQDLISDGVPRENISVIHTPETETEDEYWTVVTVKLNNPLNLSKNQLLQGLNIAKHCKGE